MLHDVRVRRFLYQRIKNLDSGSYVNANVGVDDLRCLVVDAINQVPVEYQTPPAPVQFLFQVDAEFEPLRPNPFLDVVGDVPRPVSQFGHGRAQGERGAYVQVGKDDKAVNVGSVVVAGVQATTAFASRSRDGLLDAFDGDVEVPPVQLDADELAARLDAGDAGGAGTHEGVDDGPPSGFQRISNHERNRLLTPLDAHGTPRSLSLYQHPRTTYAANTATCGGYLGARTPPPTLRC